MRTDCNYYRARARCPVHLEANTMALAFKKKIFIVRSTSKKIRGRAQICIPTQGSKRDWRGSGKPAGLRNHWQGTSFNGGPWSLAIHGKNGFSTQPPWTADPSLLKGFWGSGSSFVSVLWFCGVETLWFQVLLEVKIPLLYTCFGQMLGVFFFSCPWKTAQYIVRIRSVWAGSAFT